MALTWSNQFSVGIKEIDDQHKKLISILNDLSEARRTEKGRKDIERILDELTQYTVYHFKAEEQYMERFNYKFKKEHKEEHDRFVAKVADFIEGYKEERFMLTMAMMNFLMDWIKKHILGTDQNYITCFKENGLN